MHDEDSLRHKYAPLPDEPRFKSKKPKKKHARSDHKHDYEMVCIDTGSFIHRRGERVPFFHVGKRCKLCGRLHNPEIDFKIHEPPEDMPLYKVDFIDFITMKVLPDEMRVR